MTEKICTKCLSVVTINDFYSKRNHCKKCVNTSAKKIMCEKCSKVIANYGFISENKKRWCKKCSEPEAVLLRNKCIVCHEVCASFGKLGTTKTQWCAKCAPPDSISFDKCIKCLITTACYGLPNEGRKRVWCAKCAPPEAISINKNCVKCLKHRRSFGYENKDAMWCSKCAPEGTINHKDKKCEICRKSEPKYGYISENKKRWCSKCAPEGTKDIKSKKCVICRIKHPSFGVEDKKYQWCVKCAPKNAIFTKYPKCIKCLKSYPSFGYPNDNKASWCSECSPNGSINIRNKVCDTCNTTATYGLCGMKPTKCAKHKEKNMIYLPKKQCIEKSCRNIASYGFNKMSIHCELHKNENEISLAENPCIKCGTLDILSDKQLCVSFCEMDEKFKQFKKYQKHDELHVLNLLTDNFYEEFQYNQLVDIICGRERPDFVFNFKNIRVIIEVDENGDRHGSDCSNLSKDENELNRMKNIFHSFFGGYTVFIRYNPDKYTSDSKINLSREKRGLILIKWIEKFKNMSNEDLKIMFNLHPLAVIYLFYNNYKESDSIKFINPLSDKFYSCIKCYGVSRSKLFYCNEEYDQHMEKCSR